VPYALRDYAGMLLDEGRMQAYVESLKRRVTTASVVLDIGTGTFVFALLAARLGARKVYAIEPNDVVHFGRHVAAQNGFDQRVEFIEGLSTEVELPEKVDVIVFDLHGVLPAHERSLFSVIDARDRFLAPSGCLIPCRDTLWAALADVPTRYRDAAGVWSEDVFGIDMTAIRPSAVNMWQRVRLSPSELATTPARWAVIDYAALRSPDLRGDISWAIEDPRTAHGVCAWFDWDGVDGVAFSNSPLTAERHIFGQAFFPWPQPVDLRRGDEVCVQLRADAVASSYVYRWETSVRRDGGVLTTFQQSDFLGLPLSPERLRKLSGARAAPKYCD
jgi:protein arginine N-methyltransferase 1